MAEGSVIDILELFNIDKHYSSFKEVFEQGEGSAVPPIDSLPKNGLVIDNKAFGFLALTDCDFGFLCWYCVDKNLDNREKKEYITKIFQGLEEVARINNKSYIFCFSTKRSIIKLIDSLGYHQMGGGHLSKRL